MSLELQPITLDEAQAYVEANHRHHRAPVGWKFGIGAVRGGELVGVIVVGRPVARRLDDQWTLEVTRCCTNGTRNACSKLYQAAAQVARGLGYRRLITYILEDETGASLKACGWRPVGTTPGRSWSVPSRPREDDHPLGPKQLWEAPWSVNTRDLGERIGASIIPSGVPGQLGLFGDAG